VNDGGGKENAFIFTKVYYKKRVGFAGIELSGSLIDILQIIKMHGTLLQK